MKRADFGRATKALYWPSHHHYPLALSAGDVIGACELLWGVGTNHFAAGHAEAVPKLTRGQWPFEIEWNY